MKSIHKFVLFFLAAVCLNSCYQVDIEIDHVPKNTPIGSKLFVTGNFNKWDPGDSRYSLELGMDSIYRVSLPIGFGTLEYKFTRGDWTTVETDECGDFLLNRVYNKEESILIKEQIACWNDMGPTDCPRVTIVIDKLPPTTPMDDTIYLTANYNGWNPRDPDFKFFHQQTGDTRHMLTLFKGKEDLVFKFTRGSWETVEVNSDGSDVDNHHFSFGRSDTIYYQVDEWVDLMDKSQLYFTFVIQRLPKNTPPNDNIYLVGDFNGWNPRDVSLILNKDIDGVYSISIPRMQDYIEYKFTRGGWNTVEGNKYGRDIGNRKLNPQPGDIIYVEIESWMDKGIP